MLSRLGALFGFAILGSSLLLNAPAQAHSADVHRTITKSTTAAAQTTQVAQTAQSNAAGGSVVVQRGDTLGKIAAAHGMSWQSIAQINHIANPNRIYPGQVFMISGNASAPAAPAHQPAQQRNAAPAKQTPAKQAPAASSGSVQDMIRQTFGGYSSQALRVAACESGFNPNAVNSSSGTTGVFQFMASTWAGTPYAHSSRNNASANIQAAKWLFDRDGHSWREWSCQP